MIKRLMIWVLVLIVLFGALPLLLALSAGAAARVFSCQLDEGSVHACVIFGHDIGDMLYTMFVLGWFGMMTIPSATFALIVWAVVVLILLVVGRWRRARQEKA
jgi:hypothetical protein